MPKKKHKKRTDSLSSLVSGKSYLDLFSFLGGLSILILSGAVPNHNAYLGIMGISGILILSPWLQPNNKNLQTLIKGLQLIALAIAVAIIGLSLFLLLVALAFGQSDWGR